MLHSLGIAHSDIKPKNIVIGHDNEIYFIDFGGSVFLKKDYSQYLSSFTEYYNFNYFFTDIDIDEK